MQSIPLIITYTAMAVMLTLTCVGSAIGVTIGGNATVGGLKKKPDMFGSAMLLCVLPSTQGLYGFASFFLMLNSLLEIGEALTMGQALALTSSAISLAIVGFYSAVRQARLVANGINEMSNGQKVFGNTMILAVFPELYAILAFACTFLALP